MWGEVRSHFALKTVLIFYIIPTKKCLNFVYDLPLLIIHENLSRALAK